MSASLTTKTLNAISAGGRIGRALAVQLDDIRDGGLRTMRWRHAQVAEAAAWGQNVRREFYGELWRDAASIVGAEMRYAHGDYIVFERDGVRTRVWFHINELDDALTLQFALDKRAVHQLLKERGIPVPEHVAFRPDGRHAATDFLRANESCVVKPSVGTAGGEGVTCGVQSIDDFERAVLHAARFSPDLLLEQQATGEEYRLLFLDGELLDALKRRNPHVLADGTHSIAELIAIENRERAEAGGQRGLVPLTVDLDCALRLRHAGLSLRSVPDAGTEVSVKSAANQSGPADCETVHPSALSGELIAACTEAISLVGTRFGSVELSTTDPMRPLDETGGAIFDVNGTPGLHYHYLVRDRAHATPVAVHLLEFLLQEAKRREG
jgi:cyanophycin synthetase